MATGVSIPEQRALISCSNDVERLVIETRFSGAGTNFAWVVPFPSPPMIEPATTGLFPTLQYIFRPRVHHDLPEKLLWILFGAALLCFFACARPGRTISAWQVIPCVIMAISLALTDFSAHLPIIRSFYLGLLCSLLLLLTIRYSNSWVVPIAAIIVGLLYLSLLPVFASAKGSTAALREDVSVINRSIVGVFETATIRSSNPASLRQWLQTNGYSLPTNYDSAIGDYVKNRWVFVAARIRRDVANESFSVPQPLSFTFKTSRPVYPMRLTGVENESLRVELYVFGRERAAAAHFHTECCVEAKYPPFSTGWHDGDDDFSIGHPLLRQWVAGQPVATKLEATLTADEMRQDVWLDWKPYSEKQPNVYSRHGAMMRAFYCGSWLVLLIPLIQEFSGRWRWSRAAAVAALGVSGAVYLALPKVAVRLIEDDGFSMTTYYLLGSEHPAISGFTTPNDARKWMSGQWELNPGRENFWSGGTVREEDSPGNYSFIQANDGRFYPAAYDAQGCAHWVAELF